MTVILLFLLGVLGIAGWWLSHQGLMSKPWLESGPDTIKAGRDRLGTSQIKLGLGVFLAVVGSLFALFISAFFMRAAYPDWQTVPTPRIIWLSTGLLILGSVLLQRSVYAARNGDRGTLKTGLALGALATLGFLTAQLLAWRELSSSGYSLTSNPANGYFYMITAVHGLHILGGLIALGLVVSDAWTDAPIERLIRRSELCATYWHFLLLIWLIVLFVLIGWANALITACDHC